MYKTPSSILKGQLIIEQPIKIDKNKIFAKNNHNQSSIIDME